MDVKDEVLFDAMFRRARLNDEMKERLPLTVGAGQSSGLTIQFDFGPTISSLDWRGAVVVPKVATDGRLQNADCIEGQVVLVHRSSHCSSDEYDPVTAEAAKVAEAGALALVVVSIDEVVEASDESIVAVTARIPVFLVSRSTGQALIAANDDVQLKLKARPTTVK